MTEELPHTTISSADGFEIRQYPDHVLAQVQVTGDFMSAGNRAFGPLVRFIGGNNQSNTSIAMTAPVLQESPTEKTHTVSFVLPVGMDASSVPVPSNAQVHIVHVPSKRVAVRPFGGGWKASRFEANRDALLDAVAKAGLTTTGHPYFARFDPPWRPPFLKRNEVLIDLAD